MALLDAVKAISMYRQVKIPILGMIENMSGDIFGRGGARRKAAELGVPFLGEVPIEAEIRIKGDEGKTAALFAADSPARPHLLHVCEQTAIQVAKQLLETPSMPTLEILNERPRSGNGSRRLRRGANTEFHPERRPEKGANEASRWSPWPSKSGPHPIPVNWVVAWRTGHLVFKYIIREQTCPFLCAGDRVFWFFCGEKKPTRPKTNRFKNVGIPSSRVDYYSVQ